MSRLHLTRLTCAVAVVAALALFLFTRGDANAKLVACRSDPLVLLSDGTIVDVSADIETLMWNVTEVNYTLHVPEGVYPILVVQTPTWLTSQETFTFYSDNPPDLYTSTTTVRTKKKNVGVTAHMLVNLGHENLSGVEGQALTIEFSKN